MKTNKELDYREYDSLSLALKSEAVDKMLEYYSVFGWELLEKKEDSRYLDIVHVDLKRPHKIPNKDKLQLLQVRMESSVNKFACLRRDRHSASVIIALTSAIIGAVLLAFGILFAIEFKAVNTTILGGIIALAGVAFPLSLIPYVRKTVKRENERFMLAYREMGAEITRILASVRILRGIKED